MPAQPPLSKDSEEYARSILMGDHPAMRFGRRLFSRLPSDPRCKLCANPFGGVGGRVMRLAGRAPWPKNPKYCTACFKDLRDNGGGAEIECSLLFADVRGSTALAEAMRPGEFRLLMNRFFQIASRVLVTHDAVVDNFVGDEVIGIFIPAMAGKNHARAAIAAGQALLAATQKREAGQTPIPIGVGVNTGIAFVGTVGEGDQVDLTAMGDPVNVTSRLASAAGAGEALVTAAAIAAAGLSDAGLENRALALRGKSQPIDVVVMGPSV